MVTSSSRSCSASRFDHLSASALTAATVEVLESRLISSRTAACASSTALSWLI